jgi:hypothetical protein
MTLQAEILFHKKFEFLFYIKYLSYYSASSATPYDHPGSYGAAPICHASLQAFIP